MKVRALPFPERHAEYAPKVNDSYNLFRCVRVVTYSFCAPFEILNCNKYKVPWQQSAFNSLFMAVEGMKVGGSWVRREICLTGFSLFSVSGFVIMVLGCKMLKYDTKYCQG